VIDDDVLREEGIDDFGAYAHDPGSPLHPDIFVDPATVA